MQLHSPCQSHTLQAGSGHCQQWLPQQTVGCVEGISWTLMLTEAQPCHLAMPLNAEAGGTHRLMMMTRAHMFWHCRGESGTVRFAVTDTGCFLPGCAGELMPLNPVGWRHLSHCLIPPLAGMSKHLPIYADLLHPVLSCFARRSVPAVPRNALIPTSPFIAVCCFLDHPMLHRSMSQKSRTAHVIRPPWVTLSHVLIPRSFSPVLYSTGLSNCL